MGLVMGTELRVGLLGCGNVGAATVRILVEHADDIERRAGVRIELTRVAVRDAAKVRDVPIQASRFTTDPFAVVRDPDVDVVAVCAPPELPVNDPNPATDMILRR